ncbi:MAG: hypothetical protein K2X98_01940 [Alphaproteobacteria bacterium]|nr:hypothetical protein [Alphaproteobacteria bacterium]
MRYMWFIALFFLAGCNPFRYMAPDSASIQESHMARRGELPPPYPLYCYHTLGDKMCYEKPLKTDDQRLSGYYGPAPRQYE